jgi:hypothetical protein
MEAAVTNDLDDRLWLILIGAMLSSKPVRDDAASKIKLDDPPQDLAELWKCLTNGEHEGVRGVMRAWKVDVQADGTLPSIVRHLQKRSMKAFVEKTIRRAEMTSLQTPYELRDKFLSLLGHLDARIVSMEKADAEAKRAVDNQKGSGTV